MISLISVQDGFFEFVTNVTIGTPPQEFALQLDLGWDLLFVPSARCEPDFSNLCGGHSRYNSSASSSYHCHCGKPYPQVRYPAHGATILNGELSTDALNIAGLEIHHQTFLEATDIHSITWDWYAGYDGALGLAPFSVAESRRDVPSSPLNMMVSQELLEKNVFSLKFPSGPLSPPLSDVRTSGELMFGDTNPALYTGQFSTMPLTNRSEHMWAVDAQSISFGDDERFRLDLNNTIASFSASSFIALPGRLAWNLTEAIGAKPHGIFYWIPCETRENLPDLTFVLGGHSFSITAFEYTMEFSIQEEEEEEEENKCMTTFLQIETLLDWILFDPVENRPSVILGSPFLGAFYSVFNLDKREVGRKQHPILLN